MRPTSRWASRTRTAASGCAEQPTDMRLPPVFRPLADRAVLTVWSGLCTSTIGEDLFRVASVWLAVEVAGNMVGLVAGVQYIAMLVAGLVRAVLFDHMPPAQAMLGSRVWSGLFGAVLFGRWRRVPGMLGSRVWSAVFCRWAVAGFSVLGLSVTFLVSSWVGLAALRMVFSPVLQATLPALVRNRDAQQAINGL